jgi:hypothetical protein
MRLCRQPLALVIRLNGPSPGSLDRWGRSLNNFRWEGHVDKLILSILVWVFFLGGLFGMVMGFARFFGGATPAAYGVMGIGGGFWLLSCAIVIYIRNRTAAG